MALSSVKFGKLSQTLTLVFLMFDGVEYKEWHAMRYGPGSIDLKVSSNTSHSMPCSAVLTVIWSDSLCLLVWSLTFVKRPCFDQHTLIMLG